MLSVFYVFNLIIGNICGSYFIDNVFIAILYTVHWYSSVAYSETISIVYASTILCKHFAISNDYWADKTCCTTDFIQLFASYVFSL